MKRFALLCIAVWCAFAPLYAEGPDDQFVRVYNLIQQADLLRQNGQVKESNQKYLDARDALQKLETAYPHWNRTIVNYRKGYITEKLGPLATAPAVTPGVSPTATVPKPEPAAPGLEQVALLQEEIKNLRSQSDLLQAKLREALAVQPAAIDPRQFEKAEEKVRELQRENDLLKTSNTQQQEKLSRMTDPAAVEEARKALKEAQDSLARQMQTVKTLTAERQDLEARLKKANDKNEARLRKEEEKRTKADSGAKTQADANIAELQAKLRKSDQELAAEKTRSDVLSSEKAALEKRMAELKAQKGEKVAGTPVDEAQVAQLRKERDDLRRQVEQLTVQMRDLKAQAASTGTPVPAAAKESEELAKLRAEKAALESRVAVLSKSGASSTNAAAAAAAPKTSKRMEKAQIKRLEEERAELRKRVNALDRELDGYRAQKGPAQRDQLAEQLSILRARVEVYESRQVPYSPEEMAMFKQTARSDGRIEAKVDKKTARKVVPAALPLIADAQRAFGARRFEEAEKKYQEAVKLDEKNVAILSDLGATQLELGRLEDAEATLKRALALDSNDAQSLTLVGLLRFKQVRYDDALEQLSKASQMDPDNAITQNYLGITLSQQGQRTSAETAFRRAVQLMPGYAEAHNNLAVVYATQRPPFPELARWHYQKALANGQPKNPALEKSIEGAKP
jgi:Flp pilus assembly protein TadD